MRLAAISIVGLLSGIQIASAAPPSGTGPARAATPTAPSANTPSADEPTPEELQRARRHFRTGSALYRAASYERAVVEFNRAYALSKLPAFLFNIAQAHRLAKHLDEAVRHYRLFVAAQPEGALSDEARRYIRSLSRQIGANASSDALTAAKRPDPLAKSGEGLSLTKPVEQPWLAAPAPALVSTSEPIPPRERVRPWWRRPLVWGVAAGVAAGALAVGLGVGLGVQPSAPTPGGKVTF